MFEITLKREGTKKILANSLTSAISIVLVASTPVLGQDESELAKKLANPVASLISVPIQANYDGNIGTNDEGALWRINIQPVIPFSLNDNWNLISRTILPITVQDDLPVQGMGESGISDILQSLFFSPEEPTARGLIWGAGPVFLLPTASDEVLGSEKWGVGPTAVGLRQEGPWTYGVLTNHVWSIAGEDNRADINATFIQPFLTYITRTKTTVVLNTESTYDWKGEEWSVPLNFIVQQMLKVGPQVLQLGVGARYWADSPDGGAEDWGGRIQLTFLFPK